MKKVILALLLCMLAVPVLAQNGTISYGDVVTGTITDTEESQFWEFEGVEGDVVNITMIADDSGELDTRLYLHTADGLSAGEPAVAENDDSADENIGFFNSYIENFRLPETTTYVIEATRWNGTGGYELSLLAGDTTIAGVDEGAVFPFVEYGMEVGGNITEALPGETWQFIGSEGDVVTITMLADEASSLDTRLYLYDETSYFSQGVALAENDDSGDEEIGRFNSRIESFTLPDDGPYYIQATRFGGEGEYTLTLELESAVVGGEELRQWASSASATSQYGDDSWSATQATGEPDTFECGDITTAWASATSSGVDSLTLTFATPVRASEINIYETYNPGSITSVEISNSTSGEVFEIPESADPVGNTPCPGTFTVSVSDVDMLVDTVIINVDQTIGGGWNEIDAVELVGIVPSGEESGSEIIIVDGMQIIPLDGGESAITLAIPESWVTGFDEAFTLAATSEEALTVFTSGDTVPAPEGEIVMAVLSPEQLMAIAGDVQEQTPIAYLETVLGGTGIEGEVQTYEGFAIPAAVVSLDDAADAPPNTSMFMVQLDEGFAWVIVVTGGDFAEFEADVVAVVNSLAGTGESVSGGK